MYVEARFPKEASPSGAECVFLKIVQSLVINTKKKFGMNIERIITSTFLFTIFTLTGGIFGCDKIVSVMSDDEMPRIVSEEIPIGVVVALTGHHAEPFLIIEFHLRNSIRQKQRNYTQMFEISITENYLRNSRCSPLKCRSDF